MVKRQGKSYLLRAEDDEDCLAWIEQIQQCIDDVNEQDCQFSDEDEDVPPPVNNATVEATSDKTCKHKLQNEYQFNICYK